MNPACSDPRTAAQLDTLVEFQGAVEALILRHEHSRKPWLPGELIDHGGEEGLYLMQALRDRAEGLAPAIKVGLALQLLTEEGLPHLHRILDEHIGRLPGFARWMRQWTAEESRHGMALRDYARDASIYRMDALDRLQFQYMAGSFDPDWSASPFRLLAYTSLQERATQAAHANTARLVAQQEPLLQRMLACLSGDEARHCAFYKDCFALALTADPDHALVELAVVASAPVLQDIPLSGYREMAEVQRQAGIFGPREYAALLDELLAYWRIGLLQPQRGQARRAQDELLQLPGHLLRLADERERQARHKSYEFDFLRDAVVDLA